MEVHKIKLHTKYQRPRPSSFRQENFLNFTWRRLSNKIWPFRKKGHNFFKLWSSFFQTSLGPCLQCCIPCPRAIGPLVPEKILRFLSYMDSHLCHVNQFLSPTHWGSIWNFALTGPTDSEEMFEECGWQTDGGAGLNYKLTYEPKGSSKLKSQLHAYTRIGGRTSKHLSFLQIRWLSGKYFLISS